MRQCSTTPRNTEKLLFLDFSSAFLLIHKLQAINLNKTIIIWIVKFLTKQTDYVRLKNGELNVKSDLLMTNTEAPQEAVLWTPFLFTVYTIDRQLKDAETILIC